MKFFNNDHNYPMVSPKSASYLRCHNAAKSLVDKFEEEGMPIGKVTAIFNTIEHSFSKNDNWNHLQNLHRKSSYVGDAQTIKNFCKIKQAKDPKFFMQFNVMRIIS